MLDKPAIVGTTAQLTAVIRFTIPREEIQEVMGPAIGEVITAVTAQGIGPVGPVFSYHFKMDPGIFDIEVGVPVSSAVQPVGRVHGSELPAATVVRTVYTGPYEGLGEAWGDFMDLIEADGNKTSASLWECYVTGPESSPDPSTWRTELNRPVLA